MQTLITIYLCGFFFCLFSIISENGMPGRIQKEPTSWIEYLHFSFQWPRWFVAEVIDWFKSK